MLYCMYDEECHVGRHLYNEDTAALEVLERVLQGLVVNCASLCAHCQ